MVDDFRRRFWVSLVLTVPVVATSEMLQHLVGVRGALAFPGDAWVGFAFATAVYLYGGWPFLKGFVLELGARRPGMMTLVALAISVAYVYSALVVFGLPGSVFFWETATLIDIMLLGHWIEMRDGRLRRPGAGGSRGRTGWTTTGALRTSVMTSSPATASSARRAGARGWPISMGAHDERNHAHWRKPLVERGER
jgi:hypothetical protein